MFYERPKLITLTGEPWDAAGLCASGGSDTSVEGCAFGVYARSGSCKTGGVASPSADCAYGSNAAGAGGCQTGDTASVGTCDNGFNPGTTCAGGLGVAGCSTGASG
jgi:hypothetical protein